MIEEIASHIESGETDPGLGKKPEQHDNKLRSELGSPRELGKGFKTIYRPDRWIDFFLVVIPLFIIAYLNELLLKDYYVYVARVDVLVGLLLIAVGLWRQSALLTLFWTTARVTQITAMLLVAHGYYGTTQTVFYSFIAFGLILLWGRIVWQNRHDVLIVLYALLPLVLCAVGLILDAIHPGIVLSHYSLLVDRLLWSIYTAGYTGGSLGFYGLILAMALFLLATNRSLRFLGLAVWGLVAGFGRQYLDLNVSYRNQGYQGPMDQPVYVFWIIFPLVIVLCGWWLDQKKRMQFQLAV